MSEGIGAFYANVTRRNDGGTGSYPRYSLMYTERAATPVSAPVDEDPIFGFLSATSSSGTNAKFIAGVLNGSLPSDEWTVDITNLSAGIVIKADRVTVEPALVFNPQSSAPAVVEGTIYYDDTGKVMKYRDNAGWQTFGTSAGAPSPHGAAHHSGAIFAGANDDLGAFYLDIDDIGVPADPAATVRRLFVDTATGKLSVRTNASTTISLEEQGGAISWGAPTGGIDIGDSAVEGSSTDATRADHQHAFTAPAASYPLDIAASESDGVATTPARSDHVHAHGSGYSADAHHNQSHILSGTDHTASGLTVGWVIAADSATTFSWQAPTGGTDDDAIHDNVANEITAITPKTTLAAADEFVLEDSGAVYIKKAVTFANIEASTSLANLGTRTHASLSDAPTDAHHNEVHTLATTGPHTDTLPLTDLAAGTQGSVIIRGAADWEELGLGTNTYVLKSGATDVAWGQINYSELTGTQPAPVVHNLIDTTGHPVSGLTGGHFLKALTATTYGFAAHGLGASDVGAYTTAQVDSAIDTDIATHAALGDEHHAQSHVLSGTDHTASGLTAGWVISADTATTFSWKAPTSEISGSGTQYALPRWATTTSLGDSTLSENVGATELYASVGMFIGADATSPKIVNNADALELWSGSTPTLALTLDTSQNAQIEGYLTVKNSAASTINTDKFLVFETSGEIRYRSGSELYSDINGYVTADFTTDFAAEDLANLATAAHASLDDAPTDAHHSETHVLATTGPHTGTLPWADLDKTGSSLADLATRTHANLSDAPTDAHHSESHVLSGSTHTATGLTVGWVIAADSATTFSWQASPGGPGSGTQYTIPMWATINTLGDSFISQDTGNSRIVINGDLKVVGTEIYGNGTSLNLIANTTTDGPRLILHHGAAAYQFFYDNVERAQLSGAGNFQHDGTLTVGTIAAEATDVDKFLVSNAGVVKFRTGAEAYADMDGYTDTDTEAVITAELVDGQSIDNAIDALISTHNVANNHLDWTASVGTIHTDNYIEYTDAAVESVITAELVNGQSIDLAIDALILTHKNISDAHHAKYTNAEAIAAVVAENPLSLTNAIKIGGNSIEDSTGSEMIGFTGTGHIDFIVSQGTPPSDGDVLRWVTTNSRWEVGAGAGGGITGSGTNNQIVKWLVQGSTIQDSIIADNGSTVTVAGALTATGLATVDGLNPEADKADDLGTAALTWQDIFVQNIKDDDGTICASTQSDGSFLIKELNSDAADTIIYIGAGAAVVVHSSYYSVTSNCLSFTASNVATFDFSTILPYQLIGGKQKLVDIVVYYYTNVAGNYIDRIRIYSSNLASDSKVTLVDDGTNHGSGTTGYGNTTKTLNRNLAAGETITAEIDVYVVSGAAHIRGFRLRYTYY